jgi:hypothetical protein
MLFLIGIQAVCAAVCVIVGAPLAGIVVALLALLCTNLLIFDRLDQKDD